MGLAELLLALQEHLDMEKIIRMVNEFMKLSFFMQMTIGSGKMDSRAVTDIVIHAFIYSVRTGQHDTAILIMSTYQSRLFEKSDMCI